MNEYPHIPEKIPGLLMEYDLQPDEGAVQANPIPTMSYMDVAARANAGLAPTPRVSQNTGVETTHKVLELKDSYEDGDENLSSEVVHIVEDVPENEKNQPEDEEDQAEESNN